MLVLSMYSMGRRQDLQSKAISFGIKTALQFSIQQSIRKDRFERSLASGDFNRDGYTDLAISIHEENIGATNADAVYVLFGSPTGLTANGNQLWHQDSHGVEETAESDDRFGKALAAGDFNGDGFADSLSVLRKKILTMKRMLEQ